MTVHVGVGGFSDYHGSSAPYDVEVPLCGQHRTFFDDAVRGSSIKEPPLPGPPEWCLVHLELKPCGMCAAYVAAGL
jgi:hypothetical protein